MKILYTLLLILIVLPIQGQDFYDMETVQTIEVTFAESNWDQLLDNAYAVDAGYILAESISINGVVFDSVGVKYKGNSSYNANQVKNPWHIELDTYKDHEYDGYTDIKLANGAKDPSVMRDVLGYQIVRQYMDAPLANFANLYVNGQLIGLYANTESVSKKFMDSRFGSKNNTRFKCSPPDGAGPQATDLPGLEYLGQDSTNYYDAYEVKSDYGWQELIDLCDTLENHTAVIEEMLDVDRALWMLAFDNVIVNLDSYIGAFSQNYYLYRSDYGQFLPVVWDLNESFGIFSQTGSSSLNNTAAKQQMTHLLHENDDAHPLVQYLLSIPTYKRMYLAHIKTILLENFDNDAYYQMGLTIQATVDASVQADGNSFYSYNNFIDNLTSDIGGGGPGPGGGGQTAPGISNLMDARATYLLGLNDFTTTEPSISSISLSNDSPIISETITVLATVTDATDVFLGYRSDDNTAPFSKVQMFDDGAHGDGAANDGVYGVDLTIDFSTVEYYIYAENGTIGKFSPTRAQYEYHSINAGIFSADSGLVINEFMASNDVTVVDQDGEYEDWIELYNNDATSVDLTGYFLTDAPADLTQWSFPAGTIIGAESYLVVWLDNDEDQVGLHANFKLSSSGESLILVASDTTIVDGITYGEQITDVSYGRFSNGTGEYQIMSPTYNGENTDDSDFLLASSGLVINEFMASNDITAADQDGEYEDWVELYNNDATSIDLTGYFLSDAIADVTQWAFPAGTIIGPESYLLVWLDNDEDQTGLHANFKLSSSGESLILVDSDSTIIDGITYGNQTTDVSFARFPNGTGAFQTMDATFNAENLDDSVVGAFSELTVKVFLEGSYENNDVMRTDLGSLIPTSQPYSSAPWMYAGTETVSSIANVVDWVLVEVRTGTPNLSGSAGTSVLESQAGLLLDNGAILGTDGAPLRFAQLTIGDAYYVAVRHRNHLSVLSSSSIIASAQMDYDFTTSTNQAFGTSQQKLSTDGKAMMYAGDANGDNVIQVTDYDQWQAMPAVINVYGVTDFNLDGIIQATDYDQWFANKAKLGLLEF